MSNIENIGCSWAVCYDIDGKFYDDGSARTAISAIFRYPFDAQRYIDTFIPKENKDRFYIKQISSCEVKFL